MSRHYFGAKTHPSPAVKRRGRSPQAYMDLNVQIEAEALAILARRGIDVSDVLEIDPKTRKDLETFASVSCAEDAAMVRHALSFRDRVRAAFNQEMERTNAQSIAVEEAAAETHEEEEGHRHHEEGRWGNDGGSLVMEVSL